MLKSKNKYIYYGLSFSLLSLSIGACDIQNKEITTTPSLAKENPLLYSMISKENPKPTNSPIIITQDTLTAITNDNLIVPNSLKISSDSETSITVTWSANEKEAKSYSIYLDGNLIKSDITQKLYTLSSLEKGKTYKIGIQAIGNNSKSNIIQIEAKINYTPSSSGGYSSLISTSNTTSNTSINNTASTSSTTTTSSTNASSSTSSTATSSSSSSSASTSSNSTSSTNSVSSNTSTSSSSSSTSTSNTTTSTTTTPSTPVVIPTITVDELLFSQLHVMPSQGLTWNINSKTINYQFVGERDTLAIVSFKETNLINPTMEIWLNGNLQTEVTLQKPTNFPKSEGNAPLFKTQSYTGIIPAKFMKSGLQIKFNENSTSTKTSLLGPLNVTNNSSVTLEVLPFYLYGAFPGANGSPTLAQTQLPSLGEQAEIYEKWPVSKLNIKTHPSGFVQWPYMIIAPRLGNTAFRALNKNDQKDGYDTMSAILNNLSAIRDANGDSGINKVSYSPLIMWNSSSIYSSPGGGLGGGHRGTADPDFGGAFIHEMGHGFGLPHQGDAYTAGNYPYKNGSLLGSAWGYNATHNEFLPPFIPPTHSLYNNCTGKRELDDQNRCVKQDPMQGGNGDKDKSYFYATFSDFSTAQMQNDINKFIFEDSNFTSGYSQWDETLKTRVEVPVQTVSKGIFGFDRGLPSKKNVNVHTIIMTYSNVPCTNKGVGTCNSEGVDTNISQIYQPISYVGNLRRVIDPTIKADRDSIIPDTSANPWYCRNGGCDYTVRVTYDDNSTWHALIQDGFRPFNQASGTPSSTTQDPTNGDSFKVWGINAPGDRPIKKIELLDTPMVWNGMPTTPRVLMSR
ncbi:MAG: M66 family metalloprotease [Candidatus Sericytochromatia bacterium]